MTFFTVHVIEFCILFFNKKFETLLPLFIFFQVLIKVFAAGVNPVDTYITSGTFSIKPSLPYVPGLDGAGIVEESNEGKFKVCMN